MNDLKKIFLFLAVLLVVLIPGFNKLQAAEPFGLKIELTLDPSSIPIRRWFSSLTVGFELDNTGPVPGNTELNFTWNCNNLILEDGWDQGEDYKFFEGENLSDKVNLTNAENKKITWQVKSDQILAQNKKYKMIVEDVTVPLEALWETGGVDERCTITLTINTLTATGDFYVGSPTVIDHNLTVRPPSAAVNQDILLEIDFTVAENHVIEAGKSLKLNLDELDLFLGTKSEDIVVEPTDAAIVGSAVVTPPSTVITWVTNAPAGGKAFTIKIKDKNDASAKVKAPDTPQSVKITLQYDTELPAEVTLPITAAGNPTVYFSLPAYTTTEPSVIAIPVVISQANSTMDITVHYATTDGIAKIADLDYQLSSGDLIFPINTTILTKTFQVTILDDDELEGDETINLTLSNPTGADLGMQTAVLTILANDGAPPVTGGIQAGSSCDPAIVDSCGADSGLECDKDDRVCVPEPANRNIGTWCRQYDHCKTEDGGLELTCDENEDRCVGAVANVPCMNEDINDNPVWGDTYDEMDSSDRCDTGLYCDPGESSCQNDFGQGKIPADKLGETAEDIRDQIRNIINIALGFLGVAGVIVTIYGGVLWMTAFGDDEKVGKGKKTIIAGMIGLVIIGIAWTIVSYVLTVTQDIT